jgi:hypothetical protein
MVVRAVRVASMSTRSIAMLAMSTAISDFCTEKHIEPAVR